MTARARSVKERKKEREEDEAVIDVSQNATNHDHDENKKACQNMTVVEIEWQGFKQLKSLLRMSPSVVLQRG